MTVSDLKVDIKIGLWKICTPDLQFLRTKMISNSSKESIKQS